MSPQAVIRAQARAALRHKYARAIISLITAFMPVFLIETAAAVMLYCIKLFTNDIHTVNILVIAVINPIVLIAGVLVSPFLNGFIRVYYHNALNGEMDLKDLFCYFESGRYSRTLHLNLSFLLRMILPFILFFLPVAIYEIVSTNVKGDFYGSMLYQDFYFILTVLSTIILTLYSLKYFTVFTLYIENEELGIGELFRTSKKIMSGHSADAAKLIFSYTPWMLLCLTVLPILYVVPYMTQGLCIGAKWMTRAAYEETI